MRRLVAALTVALTCSLPIAAHAGPGEIIDEALERHILPGFQTLSARADVLAREAQSDCSPQSLSLRSSYSDAFDAWIVVSHLRFGPTEVENRGFALAFWPDPRSKTPKSLGQLIRSQDPVVDDPEEYQTVSVAARGFYALERLLYDPKVTQGDTDYTCTLIVAIARDIALTSRDLHQDWTRRYAALMGAAGSEGNPYATPTEVIKALFKALGTGLQFTSEIRLGRPLGTFDRPRPRRADARLSRRSLKHVTLSLAAAKRLAMILAREHPAVAGELATSFDNAGAAADRIEDPVFALVAEVDGRLRVEVLQQRIDRIREVVRDSLGPALGVGQGFNALDGD
ncbi:MAG: imelysin family protein [Pseudomonadota bacterium]